MLIDGRPMRRVVASNFVLGEPLLYSVFDDAGRLLLRKGTVITMPDQIDKLVARGALIEDTIDDAPDAAAARRVRATEEPVEAPKESVFERMSGVVLNLKHIIGTALRSPEQIDVPARIGKLAGTIQELCSEDLDGALASPYLDYLSPYIVAHQVFGAVLAEVVASRRDIGPAQRLPLVCAALTRDWGQLPIQGELEKSGDNLSDELKTKLREHPRRGAEMLVAAGVRERGWIEAVAQHHERIDGSGYPAALSGDALGLGGRLLGIIDIYCAMMKPRSYRNQAIPPQTALYEIYNKRGAALDGELIGSLIREIGVFPPGTLVKLKSGEVAAVKSPTTKAEGAKVYVVMNRSGMAMATPQLRDTATPGMEIAGLANFAECKPAAVTIKRIWTSGKP